MARAILMGAFGGSLWATAFCAQVLPDLLRWFVGLVGLVILLELWHRAANRHESAHAAWGSFAFGLAAFSGGCHWIYHAVHIVAGHPPGLAVVCVAVLAAIMGLWHALGGYWVARMAPRGSVLTLVAVLPATFIVIEWLRGWVLGGFPWLSAGYLAGPAFAGTGAAPLAALGGVYFLGWITALLAAVCLMVTRRNLSGDRRGLGLILLFSAALMQLPHGEAAESTLWRPADRSPLSGSGSGAASHAENTMPRPSGPLTLLNGEREFHD